MPTAERIKKQALELFNQHGIEYVGMRELAASLDMQIGNITYYYPTKDDLVNQLALDLSALNDRILDAPAELTLASFLVMRERNFRNQWDYRCLFLSFVHLVKQNKKMGDRFKRIEKERGDELIRHIRLLEKGKYLQPGTHRRLSLTATAIRLIARFWISDAALSQGQTPVQDQVRHYVRLIAEILAPSATAKGRKQIEGFLNPGG